MRTLFVTVVILLLPSTTFGAVAYDTSLNKAVGASPATNSFTVTGSDTYLVVCANHTSTTGDTVTSVTFGATSLTNKAYAAQDAGGNSYSMSLWGGAVSAGTQTITVTTSSGNVGFTAASYTGVAGGSSQATTTGTAYLNGSKSQTITFTPPTSNNWSVICATDGGGIPSAGAGSTKRSGAVFPTLFDSNGTITSPYNMTFTWAGGSNHANAVGLTLDPTAAASTVYSFGIYDISIW